jgi:hypothetical protein
MKEILITIVFICVTMITFGQSFEGFALYNAQGSNTTYLIDESLNIAHTWNLSTECNYTVQLKENGNLVRGTKYNSNQLNGAAEAGRVQELDPLGNIVWDYIYSNSDHLSHHDLTLVGDNVLLTAWEVKSVSEISAAGYTNATSDKWPTHFIELAPDGNGGADIVWEWHIWDHMCQDTDSSKPNYTSDISVNPELIDVNMIQQSGGPGPGGGGGDWFHVNGVDYNEDLDQICFSSRFASEIYIIDHSTTTLEAASHSGGNSGSGGDILYRWGNPSNYGMSGAQTIPNAVHDARWITDDGRPNGGFLQIFNNSGVSSSQSTIDGIETPLDPATGYTYILNPGQAYGPASYTTRYVCAYSASGQSASDRMSNGNIYVNASGGQGGSGVMYEVDSDENIVWGPYNSQTPKGFRYECDHPGILALESFMNSSTSSCTFLIPGCTDPDAINYDPMASLDDGSCVLDCSADLNGDSSITVADLLLVLSDFGCIENCDSTDVNGDGLTTVADLLELLSVFGTIC